MDPNALRTRVEAYIKAHIDFTLWKRASKVEKAEIASMQDFHQAWNNRLATCLIPGFDGAPLSSDSKEALWARFFMGAPPRQRRSVEQYKIVKRA